MKLKQLLLDLLLLICILNPFILLKIEMINASTVRTKSQLTFILEKSRFFDKFKNELNQRQKKVINRILEEGPGGFKGGITAKKYVAITKCSKATATRDLTELLTMQAIKQLPGKGRNVS